MYRSCVTNQNKTIMPQSYFDMHINRCGEGSANFYKFREGSMDKGNKK